jgi:hypothetical protein
MQFNLSMTPSSRITFVDTICYGNSVIWNGKEYNHSGVYIKQDIGNLLVEVFNTLGQNVLVFRPTNYPIEIKGLTQSGVYLVRITTSKREVYQGKFVVK